MHKRHVHEHPADPGQKLVLLQRQGVVCQLQRAGVAVECLSLAAKHIAAELVQQNDQCQPTLQRLFPTCQTTLQRLMHCLAEVHAYFFIKQSAAGKPAFV